MLFLLYMFLILLRDLSLVLSGLAFTSKPPITVGGHVS